MSARRIDDAYLRDPDAVEVGVLIHGERVCSTCGEPLPASTDYFTPDGASGGLTSNCRSCRRASNRASHRRRTEATS